MADRSSGNWTIELRVYPIPEIAYFGGHMFWVLKDPSGKVRQELHFFGWPGTKLPFVPRSEAEIMRDNRYMRGSIREPSLRYSAPVDEIMRRWQAGISAGQFLNETYEFDYPSEWETIKGAAGDADITNSNAGAYSIGRIMLPELVRKEKRTTIPTPGWGVDLFEYDFPKDLQGAPNDASPKEDVRPDFYNETRNDGRAQYANFSSSTRSAGQRNPLNNIAQMAPGTALRAIEAAKANDALGKLYVQGDRDTVSYMHALHRAAHPEPGSDSSRVGETDSAEQGATPPGLRRASATPADSGAAQNRLTPWMSDATAAARKALTDIKFDNSFVDRYLDGDRDAFNHMQGLIRTAYPEPVPSGGADAGSGAATPTFEPWSPKVATESQAPWVRVALAGEQMSAPGDDADAESSLASWAGYRKPDWLRGS